MRMWERGPTESDAPRDWETGRHFLKSQWVSEWLNFMDNILLNRADHLLKRHISHHYSCILINRYGAHMWAFSSKYIIGSADNYTRHHLTINADTISREDKRTYFEDSRGKFTGERLVWNFSSMIKSLSTSILSMLKVICITSEQNLAFCL